MVDILRSGVKGSVQLAVDWRLMGLCAKAAAVSSTGPSIGLIFNVLLTSSGAISSSASVASCSV